MNTKANKYLKQGVIEFYVPDILIFFQLSLKLPILMALSQLQKWFKVPEMTGWWSSVLLYVCVSKAIFV